MARDRAGYQLVYLRHVNFTNASPFKRISCPSTGTKDSKKRMKSLFLSLIDRGLWSVYTASRLLVRFASDTGDVPPNLVIVVTEFTNKLLP